MRRVSRLGLPRFCDRERVARAAQYKYIMLFGYKSIMFSDDKSIVSCDSKSFMH